MVDLMTKYFDLVSDKACCFEDMKPYLSLGDEELSRWTSFLESVAISSVSTRIPASYLVCWMLNIIPQATASGLRQSINVHALLRHNLSSAQVTPELESIRATQYLKEYLDGLKLGLNLPATELQPADDLAILTAQVFVNIWKLTEDESHLYNAACLLEYGLTKSKHSFQMRLLLVRIYTLLGIPLR